jgi:hypothetical protein
MLLMWETREISAHQLRHRARGHTASTFTLVQPQALENEEGAVRLAVDTHLLLHLAKAGHGMRAARSDDLMGRWPDILRSREPYDASMACISRYPINCSVAMVLAPERGGPPP